MSLVERISEQEDLRAAVEKAEEELWRDIKPHAEAWSAFVWDFMKRWQAEHSGQSGTPHRFPWQAIAGMGGLPPIYSSRVDEYQASLMSDGFAAFSGEDYDGDWVSFKMPTLFFTDPEGCKTIIETEWRIRADTYNSREAEEREAKERAEFVRLQRKYGQTT